MFEAPAIHKGSDVVFDYAVKCDDAIGERQSKLAKGAGEEMKAAYSEGELEEILDMSGFAVYENFGCDEMTERYMSSYNAANPRHMMKAFENVGYCLAVKRG